MLRPGASGAVLFLSFRLISGDCRKAAMENQLILFYRPM